ncbi:MAG: CYTH domain-containing protein [Mesorhizobium sp.]|nr:CYTH domain-containing protein [Mesorhizobium sp.]
MAKEIERKFLVLGTAWQADVTARVSIRQAYLTRGDAVSLRVRIVDGERAALTIKSPTPAAVRSEFEYAIPLADALDMLELRAGAIVEKIRHIVPFGGRSWEIDVFSGVHRGLVLAEIELPDADAAFERPAWLGAEVTGDPAYYNSGLAAATA